MDKGFFELFLKEIKNLNCLTMIFTFILSVTYFIVDFYVIRHHVLHTIFIDILRSIFFIIGLFSIIFLSDRGLNKLTAHIQKKLLEKEQREQYLKKLEHVYKFAKEILFELSQEQKDILYHFIAEDAIELIFRNNRMGYSSITASIDYINAKLYFVGLHIQISSTFTHTILTINEFFYDILCRYFEEFKPERSPLT